MELVRLSPELTRDLPSDVKRQERLAELNAGLQQAGMKTAATGIEDANTLATLWSMNINYIQGYFLQEPAPQIDVVGNE